MTEKKATVKKETVAKKATATKTTTAKRTVKKVEVAVDAVNVGYRAGDVYNTLSAAAKPMGIAEIAKVAKISKEEVCLGIGWLLKEGKVRNEENLVTLA